MTTFKELSGRSKTVTQEAPANIAGANRVIGQTGSGAAQAQSASGELSRQNELLREEVKRFVANLRSA